MEVRRVGIWFKEVNIEDGMKTRKIRRKVKKISRGADLLDWMGTKSAMVHFDRWVSRCQNNVQTVAIGVLQTVSWGLVGKGTGCGNWHIQRCIQVKDTTFTHALFIQLPPGYTTCPNVWSLWWMHRC